MRNSTNSIENLHLERDDSNTSQKSSLFLSMTICKCLETEATSCRTFGKGTLLDSCLILAAQQSWVFFLIFCIS